jgi:hypothetical protein
MAARERGKLPKTVGTHPQPSKPSLFPVRQINKVNIKGNKNRKRPFYQRTLNNRFILSKSRAHNKGRHDQYFLPLKETYNYIYKHIFNS